jgi:hypothetical protein
MEGAAMTTAQRVRVRFCYLVLPLLGWIASASAAEPEVAFQKQDNGLLITAGGAPVAHYVTGDEKTHRPFFKNVCAPGGLQVSRNNPVQEGDRSDHAALHPGLFLAFGDIEGHDYWRMKRRVAHEAYVKQPAGGPGRGSFAVRNRYLGAEKETVCLEECTYTLLVRPAGYLLLWDSTFWSETGEFSFGDQEEMGLAIRVHTPLNVKDGTGRILDSHGRRNEKQVWGKTADWCDYGGTVGGAFAGVTLIPHPDNFRPSWFHARDYGVLVANPFGRKAFTRGEPSTVRVKQGERFRLRFGVLLHRGKTEDDIDLNKAYADYLAVTAETASAVKVDALASFEIEGDVSLDRTKDREGGTDGSLKIAPGSMAALPLRNENGTGTVSFWIFDDGSAPADPKKHGAGPLWGLRQEKGSALTVGAVYAPYLSGNTTYAASDFDPAENERPWWNVQYLGLKRKPGWHKWTFAFDPKQGLSILYDDTDLNARRTVFNWNKTRLLGFTGLVLFGDRSGSGQDLWVDDITVELGPPAEIEPLWPPPPPPDLAPVPPQEKHTPTPYAAWEYGPGRDPDYFPIAVWLQSPHNAVRYKAAGINLFVGLWKGPTEDQLAALKEAGMPVVCAQNEVGLKHRKDRTIAGWMHGDEPDNAQSRGPGKGYGPPVPPRQIVENYRKIAAADPSRPVLLNLGQGVAWDAWRGRGVRTNHPEDYPEYVEGCDIASFDIYPAVHRSDTVRGNLWYVAHGVFRLRRWTGDRKVVWNCIECTRISNPSLKPTPHQVRAEVWMAIIHGSRGLIYFVHQFKPTFVEAGLLADAEMLEAVTAINRQIHSLAAVINSPTLTDAATVTSSNPHVPVNVMVKRHDGATYLFAVAMYRQETEATFRIAGLAARAVAEILGENRTVRIENGRFTERFKGYDVRIYKIPASAR